MSEEVTEGVEPAKRSRLDRLSENKFFTLIVVPITVAVITATATLIASHHGDSNGSRSSIMPPAARESSSTPRSPDPTEEPDPSQSPTGISWDRTWGPSELALSSTYSTDLDSRPRPTSHVPSAIGDVSVRVLDGPNSTYGPWVDVTNFPGAAISLWSSKTTPTPDDCDSQLDTTPDTDGAVFARPGQILCLRSEDGAIAVASVLSAQQPSFDVQESEVRLRASIYVNGASE